MNDVLNYPGNRVAADGGAGWTGSRYCAGSPQVFVELIGELYDYAPKARRAELLECLLRPVGPLAMVAIADGAFRHLMFRLGRDPAPVSADQIAGIGSDQVLELARYVVQCSPDVLRRAASQLGNWADR